MTTKLHKNLPNVNYISEYEINFQAHKLICYLRYAFLTYTHSCTLLPYIYMLFKRIYSLFYFRLLCFVLFLVE
jgi:hypothetical protein